MKSIIVMLISALRRVVLPCAFMLIPLFATAHEGHGIPGTLWHEMQHQLWNFGGLVLLAALVLALGAKNQKDE